VRIYLGEVGRSKVVVTVDVDVDIATLVDHDKRRWKGLGLHSGKIGTGTANKNTFTPTLY